MIKRADYLKALEIVKRYKEQCDNDLIEIKELYINNDLKHKHLFNVGLSVRVLNILYQNAENLNLPNIDFRELKVLHLDNISLNELYKCRNMGKNGIEQIKALIENAGLNYKR